MATPGPAAKVRKRVVKARVIKLGGSLLKWPEWPAQFRRWLDQQSPASAILIVGGGALADEVRDRDRTACLMPSIAHWLAIDAMCANVVAVRQLLTEAVSVDRWEDLHEPRVADALVAFCPRDFLERIEPVSPCQRLPNSWDVTSDSIAARLTELVGADELVLLKSAQPPSHITTLRQAAGAGYVDRCFPQFASAIAAVRCCNLRSDDFAEWSPR